jgi:hypothetical protein
MRQRSPKSTTWPSPTLEQLALARFWHVNQSPFRNSVMNGLAFDLIREHRPKDARPRAS